MSPVFVPPTPVSLPGLGVDTHQIAWLGRPVLDALHGEARAAGLVIGRGDAHHDRVTLTPGAVASAAALQAFVAHTDDLDGDVCGVLQPPFDRWQRDPALGPCSELVRLRGPGPIDAERLAAAHRVDVPVEGRAFDVPLLDRIGGRTEVIDGSLAVVVSTGTWAGLLWANLLGLAPHLIRSLPGRGLSRVVRLLSAATRARSWDRERVGERLIRRGPGARIHPDATVEASELGEGAVVDAGAVVRHTILGAGARVEAQALCVGSVIGPGAVIQRRGFVSFGVLDAGAICGGTLQLGYLGPRAQLKVGGLLLDQVLGGPVRVQVDGELHEAPLGILGAALGAEAMVGARVTVAAGRVVPAGVTVVAGDGSLLLRPGGARAGRHRVVDGGLEPC